VADLLGPVPAPTHHGALDALSGLYGAVTARPNIAQLRDELGLSRCRTEPFQHQIIGIDRLVNMPWFFLADEMGAGKTKQVIDAAQVLYFRSLVDTVIVVCPAPVRGVWYDDELGELRKHLWIDTPVYMREFHQRMREWSTGPKSSNPLRWFITNYDFVRSPQHLVKLLKYVTPRTLLVLDESSAVKNFRAGQTRAMIALRARCQRIVLLNGTPIANSPLDLFSQGFLMDPAILGCSSPFHFRSKYAVMGGFLNKQVLEWRNLDDIQRRLAPYVLRRLKSDCLDLPPKLPSVALNPVLTQETWRIYKKMRDDMLVWLDAQVVATAPQAGVKAMRLAQITSGFVGGVLETHLDPAFNFEEEELDETAFESSPTAASLGPNPLDGQQLDQLPDFLVGHPNTPTVQYIAPREIGSEKLNLLVSWIADQLVADPSLKLLVWCRFRPELARYMKTLAEDERTKHVALARICGGQKKDERKAALRLLDPRTAPSGPVIVCGTPASGSLGLNLAACHTVVYASNDYSLKTRLQSEDRVHRPGQTSPVSYFDIVAVGPAGQKTVDHGVLKALREKQNLAAFTVNAWRQLLSDE